LERNDRNEKYQDKIEGSVKAGAAIMNEDRTPVTVIGYSNEPIRSSSS
jgi:hypothetical protein